ncbi:hypothetical protein K488DRAFT_87912 [Vararia minispora EC-137]|uniref:Uncharacterized protein n=1 Tax=Vararia minispora EC-137 TaxID=1314806 RepID=A0ACB8QF39_9AGAM|nr:hypothetical protein K488DRAFT_87912 [Vararia minispora EC-137]
MSNATEAQAEASSLLYDFTFRRTLPLFILETAFFGMASAAALLYGCIVLSKGLGRRYAGIAKLAAAAALATIIVVHWALSLDQILDIFWGRVIPLVGEGTADASIFVLLFGGIVLETALFGAFCSLLAAAVFILVDKGLRYRPNRVMLALIIIMFLLSAAHWSSQVAFDYSIHPTADFWISKRFLPAIACSLIFLTANVLLSDAIVLWRMYILWKNNVAVPIIGVVLWIVTLGLSVANIRRELQLIKPSIDGTVQPSYSNPSLGSATQAFSLITNVIATSLISWKAWGHRKQIRRYFCSGTRTTMVERVMALLVESGMLYCVIWTLYIVSGQTTAFNFIPGMNPPSNIDGEITIARTFLLRIIGLDFFNRLMAQITGIYPTIIIVLVALQRTHCDRQFTYYLDTVSAPAFATNPSRGTGASSDKSTGRSSRLEVLVSYQAFSTVDWHDGGSQGLELDGLVGKEDDKSDSNRVPDIRPPESAALAV